MGLEDKTDRLFQPFAKKMAHCGLAPIVINTFRHYFGRLVRGETGLISKADIAPVTEDEIAEIRKPILEKYEFESTPYYSGARLWDDGMIGFTETREALALSIAMARNAPFPDQNYGVFRM